jgi:hypothetical protein
MPTPRPVLAPVLSPLGNAASARVLEAAALAGAAVLKSVGPEDVLLMG